MQYCGLRRDSCANGAGGTPGHAGIHAADGSAN